MRRAMVDLLNGGSRKLPRACGPARAPLANAAPVGGAPAWCTDGWPGYSGLKKEGFRSQLSAGRSSPRRGRMLMALLLPDRCDEPPHGVG